jgi:hypothetical protein
MFTAGSCRSGGSFRGGFIAGDARRRGMALAAGIIIVAISRGFGVVSGVFRLLSFYTISLLVYYLLNYIFAYILFNLSFFL